MQEEITVLVLCRKEQNGKFIIDSLSNKNNLHIVSIEKDITGAIMKTTALKPNILLIELPKADFWGIDLAAIIRRRSPETMIAVICENEEDDYAEKALSKGIRGVFLKREDMDKLALAVQVIYLGGYFINSSIASRTICVNSGKHGEFNGFSKLYKNIVEGSLSFSRTELSIIAVMAEGVTDDAISRKLHISKGTIRNYISEIKLRTGLNTRIQIVLYALFHGLIRYEP